MTKAAEELKFNERTGPRFITRVLMNAVGLGAASAISVNIEYVGGFYVILIAALILSIINAVIRPIVVILALPAIVVSLGIFMLVVNGFMVWLISFVYPNFEVRTFGAAVLAAIIVWIVNYALSMIFVPGE